MGANFLGDDAHCEHGVSGQTYVRRKTRGKGIFQFFRVFIAVCRMPLPLSRNYSDDARRDMVGQSSVFDGMGVDVTQSSKQTTWQR